MALDVQNGVCVFQSLLLCAHRYLDLVVRCHVRGKMRRKKPPIAKKPGKSPASKVPRPKRARGTKVDN